MSSPRRPVPGSVRGAWGRAGGRESGIGRPCHIPRRALLRRPLTPSKPGLQKLLGDMKRRVTSLSESTRATDRAGAGAGAGSEFTVPSRPIAPPAPCRVWWGHLARCGDRWGCGDRGWSGHAAAGGVAGAAGAVLSGSRSRPVRRSLSSGTARRCCGSNRRTSSRSCSCGMRWSDNGWAARLRERGPRRDRRGRRRTPPRLRRARRRRRRARLRRRRSATLRRTPWPRFRV